MHGNMGVATALASHCYRWWIIPLALEITDTGSPVFKLPVIGRSIAGRQDGPQIR
jgi:hypothetical protein